MGKSTISIAIFNSYICLPEGRSAMGRFAIPGYQLGYKPLYPKYNSLVNQLTNFMADQ